MYTKSLQTGWKPRAKYRAMREDLHQDFRDKFHIICEGDNLPPPVSAWPTLLFVASCQNCNVIGDTNAHKCRFARLCFALM